MFSFYWLFILQPFEEGEKHKVVSYFSTVNLYYTLNFLFIYFYLLLASVLFAEIFQTLFLKFFGKFFMKPSTAQYTKIDCFQVAVRVRSYKLVARFYKTLSFQVVLILTLYNACTIGLRYHYALDLLAAVLWHCYLFTWGSNFPEKD